MIRATIKTGPIQVRQPYASNVGCPNCGSTERDEIAIGFYSCSGTVVQEWTEMVPDQQGMHPERRAREVRCGLEYQESDSSRTQVPLCHCSTYSVGVCAGCSDPVCGNHSRQTSAGRLCSDCLARHEAKLAAAEEAASQVRAAEQESALRALRSAHPAGHTTEADLVSILAGEPRNSQLDALGGDWSGKTLAPTPGATLARALVAAGRPAKEHVIYRRPFNRTRRVKAWTINVINQGDGDLRYTREVWLLLESGGILICGGGGKVESSLPPSTLITVDVLREGLFPGFLRSGIH